MDGDDLTISQLEAFAAIERAGSVLSLLGCIFVIATFCSSKAFHKPINRLIFYASFGNLMTNVATLMARTYLGDTGSPGCQLQAFLIQMFMPADTFWALAMAMNVYLTFYHKFDAQKLRKMEIPYLLFCYGVPFIVAIGIAFVNSPEKGRMYGDATLWCWISAPWDVFRIATFYGPIWIVILLTFFIYIRAGREIYKKHRQLRHLDFSSSHHEPEPHVPSTDPYGASKTTEVFVTSEIVDSNAIDLAPLGRRPSDSGAGPRMPGAAYSVTISSNKRPTDRESYDEVVLPIQSNTTPQSHQQPPQRPHNANPTRRRAAYEANSAAWSYAKCAFLFFTAMLVTWIPSSANRVYSVVHTGQISLPLEYMSALVLPLQGFWNGAIYVLTSWQACKMLWADLTHANRASPSTKVGGGFRGADNSFTKISSGRNGSKASDKSYESESMTELATQSRPSSHEQNKR